MNASALRDLKSTLWWAARRKFAVKGSILLGNVAETPDAAYGNIGGDFPLSTAALDIETATMPCAMIVAGLTVLRLSLWAMGLGPLRDEISLHGRQ